MHSCNAGLIFHPFNSTPWRRWRRPRRGSKRLLCVIVLSPCVSLSPPLSVLLHSLCITKGNWMCIKGERKSKGSAPDVFIVQMRRSWSYGLERVEVAKKKNEKKEWNKKYWIVRLEQTKLMRNRCIMRFCFLSRPQLSLENFSTFARSSRWIPVAHPWGVLENFRLRGTNQECVLRLPIFIWLVESDEIIGKV